MGANSGTLQVLANQLGLALGLLEDELADAGLSDLLAKLGVRLPPELAAAFALATAAEAAATDAAGLAPLLQALATAVEADDFAAILPATENLISQIAATVGAVGQVEAELTAAVAGSALTTAQQAELAAFAETTAERILDYLVVRRLAESAPLLLATLDIAGLLDHEPVDVATDDPLAVSHTRSELHLDRLGTMVSAPADHLKTVYGWGGPDFDALELFGRLQRLLDATGQVQTHLLTPAGQSPLLEAYLLGFQVDDTVTPTGLVVSVRFPGSELFTRSYPLRDPWTIEVDATAAFAEDLSAAIAPPFAATLKPPSGTVDATVTAGLHATPPAGMPVVLIGDPGGTRLQADRAAFDAGFAVTWDPAANQATGEPTLSLTLTNGHLIVSLGGADGFLASVLPQTLDVTAAVDAEWRPSTGLVFKSGAALVVTIPVNARIGPAHIAVLDVGLGVDPSALTLGLRLSGDIALGPFAVSVKDVGAAVALGFERGNLGRADLTFRFLPPTGLGLSVGSGPITGGGFIGYDPATGQYAGSLQLSAGSVGVNATGLLDTRLPTGSGYALLILLRATFPAIEIGFGFALTSVGGLLALNRSVDVDALRVALAAGTAGRILAPEDPVRNAPMLLADLETAFPVTPGVTVVGPTLELIWAELVTFDIGVFFEFPGPRRVVLLGSARATIDNPNGGAPYLQIRVDILGEIDVQKKTAAFDAVLVDSSLMQILQLTGGAAFRLSYGAEPYVVLTIGGFFPGFSPSPLVFPVQPDPHRHDPRDTVRHALPALRGLLRAHHEHAAVRRLDRGRDQSRPIQHPGPAQLRHADPAPAVPLHVRHPRLGERALQEPQPRRPGPQGPAVRTRAGDLPRFGQHRDPVLLDLLRRDVHPRLVQRTAGDDGGQRAGRADRRAEQPGQPECLGQHRPVGRADAAADVRAARRLPARSAGVGPAARPAGAAAAEVRRRPAGRPTDRARHRPRRHRSRPGLVRAGPVHHAVRRRRPQRAVVRAVAGRRTDRPVRHRRRAGGDDHGHGEADPHPGPTRADRDVYPAAVAGAGRLCCAPAGWWPP